MALLSRAARGGQGTAPLRTLPSPGFSPSPSSIRGPAPGPGASPSTKGGLRGLAQRWARRTWGAAGDAPRSWAPGLARFHGRQMARAGCGWLGAGASDGAAPGGPPPAAEEARWGPGLCASGGAACPPRRAGGAGGDTPSCHRRCPGLSWRARAGRGGNRAGGRSCLPASARRRPGGQCACAARAPRDPGGGGGAARPRGLERASGSRAAVPLRPPSCPGRPVPSPLPPSPPQRLRVRRLLRLRCKVRDDARESLRIR